MTVRNLDPCFRPRSVAIIGASPRPGSVGNIILNNVVGAGFDGPVMLVNPKYDRIGTLECFRSSTDLPEAPDLAVIATPPSTVPGVVADLAGRGCKAAVVVTAGVGSADGLRQKMLDAARPTLMRIVGPNTIGAISPWVRLNASFAPTNPAPGGIALVSQSGAMVTSIVDWAAAEGVGFSQLISLGDMADVDVGDCLNWLALDQHTKAILLYLESVPHARKFMSAARAASRVKPVIALKPGRHEQAAKAAMTHTGSLTGADNVIDAALRRAGVIRVNSIEELFSAAEVTSHFPSLERGRVGIVTNGGGAGVLAVDDLLDLGGELADISQATIDTLDKVLPPTWSRTNPVDIIGDAPPERYRAAVEATANDPAVDVVLAMNCPTALASPIEAASAVARLTEGGLIAGKPLIACWLGEALAAPARAILRQAKVVTADTPAAAARAVSFLTDWSTLRSRLQRVPGRVDENTGDAEAIDRILRGAASENRRILTEPEAKAVLVAAGLPCPPIAVAKTIDEVESLAAEMLQNESAVVVKLYSKTMTHKSDVGGVVLNLTSAAAARMAAEQIQQRVSSVDATALDGFVVQPMVRRPRAYELLIGLTSDAGFGPVVMFGAGGTAVEVVRDTATSLLPVDDVLAGDMINATRIGRLLAGYRDRAPVDRAAVVKAILTLSQLAVNHPSIVGADINPLLADEHGVVALDARIEIDPARIGLPAPNPALAIQPYPTGWAQDVTLGGRDFHIRPIMPADAYLYPHFLERVTAEDMRLRFLVPTRRLSQETLVRLSQLDYDRDIAFIALDRQTGELAGIVRYNADPDRVSAEFGLLVRSDLQGLGLGTRLMQALIAYGRDQGVQRLTGLVLRENRKMLDIAQRVGFGPATPKLGTDLVEVSLGLGK
ncbi:MAG: bifunctional acyl-CoA synthetase/GNAT family N-acetyltransferase [Hyphomicrobiales bacterium]|nr:MAG: bifunctional acyl-CoA synthetase/GNAT family N-acetyltransferase [Hyphomicrobiales bacterium]